MKKQLGGYQRGKGWKEGKVRKGVIMDGDWTLGW